MEHGIKPRLTFEDLSHENGITYWWASDFMRLLGYQTLSAFMKPMNRAMTACLSASIDCHDNFIKKDRVIDGVSITDFKLTRFACYIISMNGDTKKPEVAKAQVYFAKQAESISLALNGANDVERIITRAEIKDGNKSLASAAKQAGVVNFGIFQDAGYIGMYNSSIKKLSKIKGISEGQSLYDFMGKTELSANLFRINLTEEKLKQKNVHNASVANAVHKEIGSQIRKMVKDNTGLNPEQLPLEKRLGDVNKELKKANKQLNEKKK